MFDLIVWASDGSEHADRALDYARALAEAGSGRVLAVHVNEITVGRAGGYPVDADEEETEAKIQKQVEDLRAAGIDATYRQAGAAVGGAAHAIADLAAEEKADVIVVGTRGHAPITGLLVGSVTHRLLHVAHCPVLAVPKA